MKPTRIGWCAVASFIVFVMVVGVAMAAPSTNKELFNNLNSNLLYLAVPIILAVELILFFSVWKYRNNAENRQPTRENRRLELTWTFATAIVLIYVGAAAFFVLGNPYISPEAAGEDPGVPNDQLQGKVMPKDPDAVVVDLTAYQFGWEFTYTGTNVTTQGMLVIPANTNVYIHVTSRDVLHSFYVPALGLKQDVIPDRYNTVRTKVKRPGTYQLYCAEYCGSGHARMLGNITVVSKTEYQNWLAEQKNASIASQSTKTDVDLDKKSYQRVHRMPRLHRWDQQIRAKPTATS